MTTELLGQERSNLFRVGKIDRQNVSRTPRRQENTRQTGCPNRAFGARPWFESVTSDRICLYTYKTAERRYLAHISHPRKQQTSSPEWKPCHVITTNKVTERKRQKEHIATAWISPQPLLCNCITVTSVIAPRPWDTMTNLKTQHRNF